MYPLILLVIKVWLLSLDFSNCVYNATGLLETIIANIIRIVPDLFKETSLTVSMGTNSRLLSVK